VKSATVPILGESSILRISTLMDAASLTVGSTWELLDWVNLMGAPASPAGTFRSIFLPTLLAGSQWNTSALYTTGTVSIESAIGHSMFSSIVVTPEPSRALLLLLGLAGLLLRRRRRFFVSDMKID
jgi:hypothetical protein